ncbi:hypothetical protein HW537_14580 [Asaia siamensis]
MSADIAVQEQVGKAHLEAFEASLMHLRRHVGVAIVSGLPAHRDTLEQKIGQMQAILHIMGQHDEISPARCLSHANAFLENLKVR